MLTVTGIGRVTADLEPKRSEKTNTEYLRFNLAVNKPSFARHGENQRTVFLQCMLYGEQQVQRMVNAKVQKGSLIAVTGELDVEEYSKKDGTKDKAVKVTLYDWSYVPSTGKTKDETSAQPNLNTPENAGMFDGVQNDDDLPF